MNRKYPSSNPKSNQWSKGEMYLSYAKKNKNMNDTFKGIIIGVISSLIASGIIYAITESFVWSFTLPLWIWLCISLSIFLLTYTIRKVVICCKVKNFISEFTEGSFGNSYVYTWKYKRCRKGEYSAYGYEATDIHTKKPLAEMNNDRTITLGHEIPEETIKMIIQLLIIANIDKKKGSQLKNVLKYLDWTEDSSKHQLLH